MTLAGGSLSELAELKKITVTEYLSKLSIFVKQFEDEPKTPAVQTKK